jgi:hypothetical protein
MDDELRAAEEFFLDHHLDDWTPEELNTLGQLCIRRGRDKALTPQEDTPQGEPEDVVVTGVG